MKKRSIFSLLRPRGGPKLHDADVPPPTEEEKRRAMPHRYLEPGDKLYLKKRTPVMSAPTTKGMRDGLKKLQLIVYLDPGTEIEILERGYFKKYQDPHYRIRAGDVWGWINSLAVIGRIPQRLKDAIIERGRHSQLPTAKAGGLVAEDT